MLLADGLYLALAVHSNLAVDMIEEDALTASALARYSVVAVTQPNLPAEGLASLLAWVRAGGTLITTSGAAAFDRYNSSTTALDTASQVTESRPRPRLNLGAGNYSTGMGPWPVVATGTVLHSGAHFFATGVRTSLSVRDNSSVKTMATFTDGSPAAIAAPLGDGKVVRIAIALGLTYVENASNWERLPRVDEFPNALREMLVSVALGASGAVPVCNVSSSFVETALLLAPEGAVLTVMNWDASAEFNASAGLLHVHVVGLPFAPTRVFSAEHGKLAWKPGASVGAVSFAMPIQAADFVLFWK